MSKSTLLVTILIVFCTKFSTCQENSTTRTNNNRLSEISTNKPNNNYLSRTEKPLHRAPLFTPLTARYNVVEKMDAVEPTVIRKKSCYDETSDPFDRGQQSRFKADHPIKRILPPQEMKLVESARAISNANRNDYQRLDELDPEEREERINRSFARLMQTMTFLGHVDNYLTDKASSFIKVMSKAMDAEEPVNNDAYRMSRPCS